MPKIRHRDWSPEYMEWAFTYWYNHGRPKATQFYNILPRERSPEYPEEFFQRGFAIPDILTLKNFIDEVFEPRAARLDLEAKQTVDTVLVAEKVEMLRRHASVASKMQDIAIDFLEKHKDDLGVNNAVKLLVEGIRVERESKGIPAALEKMGKMSDEQLLEEIQELVAGSPIEMIDMKDVEIIVNSKEDE